MSRSLSSHPETSPVERIEDVDVTAEMERSFLEYAYSVIYSRALPDARDGLKPVHRRILYQMSEMGLRPDKGHVKSARVVGEVMGKLHPHGDSAIYDALVRLAQSFTMRLPLVDGHGNFGSLDDGPAASRYTEARLTAAALAMTMDLDEDVVDFVPNYDNQLTQPDVLPAALPNLLINGAAGIAVGMATNMAPHNVGEVIAAARHVIDHPHATVDDLMAFLPGPDLPTGGTIIGLSGIKDAYTSGRGSFKMRARISIESITARKSGLIVTELPYLVGPERVIEKIKDGVNAKKLAGISDVTDLTDRKNGLRIVIGIKTGFSPEAVRDELYRYTPLEENFTINNVALVDGGPRTLGLKDLLQVYVDHRIAVVTRRSQFRLDRRQERLHLVEGLLRAILDIDEVIQVIRSSDNTDQARDRLTKVFSLSERQAEYILELRLRRLTKFSRIELEAERDNLAEEITYLEGLLASPEAIRALVSDELAAISENFDTPRRTILSDNAGELDAPRASRREPATLELADTACRVFLSATGALVRTPLESDEGEAALRSTSTKRGASFVRSWVDTTTHTEIGAITSHGRLVRFTALDLPSLPREKLTPSAGVAARDYLGLNRDESVVAVVSLDASDPIALGTRQGIVKRLIRGDWAKKPDFEIIGLKDDDQLVGAAVAPDTSELVFVTSDAQLLHFSAHTVRPQGRAAGGMAGIRVNESAKVLFFGVIGADEPADVVTISTDSRLIAGTDPGRAKVSSFSDFPGKGRGTGGVRAHTFLKGEDSLAHAWVGRTPAAALGSRATTIPLPEGPARRDASGTPLRDVIDVIGGPIPT